MPTPLPDVVTLVRRGQLYAQRGDFVRALEAFTGAIDLTPLDAELYYQRGNAYAAAGQFELAIEDYTEVVALKPDYAAAFHNRGLVTAIAANWMRR